MNVILFDGEERSHLLPLTYTRPVSELRVGIFTIREKWERRLSQPCSWLTIPYLREKYPVSFKSDNLYIKGNIIPDKDFIDAIYRMEVGECLVADGKTVAIRSGKEHNDISSLIEDDSCIRVKFDNPVVTIEHLWEIFMLNGSQINEDFELLKPQDISLKLDHSNHLINKERIYIEPGAKATCSIINAENGPVYLGRDSTIMEGSMIRGPYAMGEHSVVKMGAKIYEGTTLGPHCKVAGEVNNVVFTGYSSKQHDGYLGNAVIGEWCNLGAGSNNSNLKNNYKAVKLWDYPKNRFIQTGLQFCGLIMGDHSKCGIQTMFNTGTVVGVSANIYGSGFPRNFIPSFSWGGAHGFSEYSLSKALEVAQIVMERRNITFDRTEVEILSEVFKISESYRKY